MISNFIKGVNIMLFISLLMAFTPFEEQNENSFVGYGWIVGISKDIVFVPANLPNKYPSIQNYFKQQDKYGYIVDNYFGPGHGLKNRTAVEIYWPSELSEDNIRIVPVIASFEVRDTMPISAVRRIYTHLGNSDTISYVLMKDFNFKFIYLD